MVVGKMLMNFIREMDGGSMNEKEIKKYESLIKKKEKEIEQLKQKIIELDGYYDDDTPF